MIGVVERQLDRLKKHHAGDTGSRGVEETTPAALGTVTPTAAEAAVPSAQPALTKMDDPQVAAELDALLARLEPDDEPDRPAGVDA